MGMKEGVKLWERNKFGFRHKNVVGRAGGILVAWNQAKVKVVDSRIDEFSVSIRYVSIDDSFEWVCTRVYGPTDPASRQLMWEELCDIKRGWDLPLCKGGDFNIIRVSSERMGGCRMDTHLCRFSDIIQTHHLIDLPLEGTSFTWSNHRDIWAMSKLDRFPICPKWDDHFHRAKQIALPKRTSDHIPILLHNENFLRGPAPFRSELIWMEYTRFKEKVRNWWTSLWFFGTASFVFGQKLWALKKARKLWNLYEFGRIGARKNDCL